MSELLTPEEAALIAGAPVEQLKRWAFLGVGPKNTGTRWRPKFTEEDLRQWLKQRAA